MDTRNTLHSRRRSRGAFRPVAIAILAVIGLLAVAAWFLIVRPYQAQILADAGGHPSTPISVTNNAAPPPVNVKAMGVSELLSEAGKAVREQRLLAPAGNNAFEFYLQVLQRQPGNPVATDALRETFPFAATSAEQVVNRSDFTEAQRQIDLLAKADPTNFTLTILRSKLDAQRKVLDKQQQLALDQQKAQELAQQKAAADKLAADQQAAEAARLAATQQKAQPARTPANTVATTTDTVTAPEPNAVRSTEAVLVNSIAARYPPSAMRAQQEGWVVVAFTIDPNGETSGIEVVNSEPRRVFDRAAIDAVSRYRFTPATRGGVAISSKQQQRIEFKLR